MTTATSRRAGPLFGAVLAVVALLAAVSPVIPAVSALDPTPDPLPTVAPAATVDPAATVEPAPTPDPTVAPTPDATVQPATPGLHVNHYWVSTVDVEGALANAGATDEPRTDLQPYNLYLVRFQVLNSGDRDLVITPTLRYGAAGSLTLDTVPSLSPLEEIPFYVANDQGRSYLTRVTPITPADLRLATSADDTATAVDGEYIGGLNPGDAVTLRAHSFTEVEFGVRPTGDTDPSSSWILRLDLGAATVGNIDAEVALGAAPPIVLPPNQKAGSKQDAPVPTYKLRPPVAGAGPVTVAGAVTANPPSYASPHMSYQITDDSCAACHAAHRASGQMLLQGTYNPTSGLCFNCHDGTGATGNVQGQYAAVSAKPNVPATGSYYSHPATTKSAHALDNPAEFAGVLNRHSLCIDCHDPHVADATTSVQSTAGWTAGGPIAAAAGVAVTNGAANTVPTYSLVTSTTYEYQLCFKCHSSYTTLLTQDPAHPSRWALDKAYELNPANTSFHPVEAAGKNATAKMTANLAGTSTYKLWAFTTTSTIRCENCHGSSGQTKVPANAGATSDNHASTNRGILLAPYRDRLLKPVGEGWLEGEFELCFMCHSNEAFLSTNSDPKTTSNFRYHGLHTSGIPNKGTTYAAGDIDTDGAGTGNALCSECHFRIHSSSLPVDGQAKNSRLVNFSPNVQAFGGGTIFVPKNGLIQGSCQLTCHGQVHEPKTY